MKAIFMALFVCTCLPAAAGQAAQPLQPPQELTGQAGGQTALLIASSDDSRRKQGFLKNLTRQLAGAKDPANANLLAGTIRKLWRETGSPTIRLLMQRATILIEAGDQAPALRILDSVVEIAPEYSEGWFLRAVLLFQMNEIGRALHDVGQALDLNSAHFDALRQLGLILNRLGDQKGALNAYRRARLIYPSLPGIEDAIKTLTDKVDGRAI